MRRAGAFVGLVLLSLVLIAGPALADTMVIRKVDTTDFPQVRMSVLVRGKTPNQASFQIRENGGLVKNLTVSPISKTQVPVGIVLVMDISGSMKVNGKIEQAKVAAKDFIAKKSANTQIALVVFADDVKIVSDFTTDQGALATEIDGLVPNGETALWDGIRRSLALFDNHPTLQRNLVVLSDGADTASNENTADGARSGALSSKATVFAIGLKGGDFEPAPLRAVAEASGGEYRETADPAQLGPVYAQVQRSIQDNQYEVSYTSSVKGPTLDVVVAAGDVAARASSISTGGTVAEGSQAQPVVVSEGPTKGVMQESWFKWIILLGVIIAAAMAMFAIVPLLTGTGDQLNTALQPYAGHGVVVDTDDDGPPGMNLADTAFIQRAVAATGRFAERQGLMEIAERKLEQADLPIRAAEAIFFWFVAAVVLGALGFALNGLLWAIALLAIGLVLPIAVLNFLATRRRKKFTSQLPDALQLLAGSLRAGYSLMQGLEAVSQETPNPIGKELRRIIVEARLGRPLEEALEDTAGRLGSPDFEWAVMAIRIQREVGGNLAELLDTVSETMVQRERLRREVQALTAEGRISAIVLGILPVGIGGVLWVINREYMEILINDSFGKVLLFGSIILALFGFYWMKKTIEIEI